MISDSLTSRIINETKVTFSGGSFTLQKSANVCYSVVIFSPTVTFKDSNTCFHSDHFMCCSAVVFKIHQLSSC